MENLEIYNKVRKVPPEAQRKITGGRLNGKTDINPMWRIKALTEQFGVCGVGWKYVITEKRLERSSDSDIAAFVDIDLFIKVNETWSDAIPGTGGSSFLTKEKNGLYMSDECFKMALTDAISVACKAIGVGADIYWEKDATKYNASPTTNSAQPASSAQQKTEHGSVAEQMEIAYGEIEAAGTLDDVKAIWYRYPNLHVYDTFKIKCTNRKGQLTM